MPPKRTREEILTNDLDLALWSKHNLEQNIATFAGMNRNLREDVEFLLRENKRLKLELFKANQNSLDNMFKELAEEETKE